jgi:PPOX class probable F420-dependent enzyme
MRTNITVEDVGGFLEEPLVAVLATLRADGSVLLSPVWHEWCDGAFNVWTEADNVKARHLRRDPRATIVVAESDPPLRGVEVRGSARFVEENITETARRIATRYIGEEEAATYAQALSGADVIVRIEPRDIRVWDYADQFEDG